MPFENNTTFPGSGSNSFGDFILDVWLAFARDDVGWVDNRAPAVGTRPDIECWTHRGTVGAPEPPFIFLAAADRHLALFSGDGVDLGEELYDQPNNPANEWAGSFPTGTPPIRIPNTLKCPIVNSAVPSYDEYWLFAPTDGRYVYCVLKVGAREYRHFHVGLLDQVDGGSDLPAGSFFYTGHFWEDKGPEKYNTTFSTQSNPGDKWPSPYHSHRIPFRGNSYQDGSFGSRLVNTVPGMRVYVPGYDGHAYDWYHCADGADLTTDDEGQAVKTIGTVNTPLTLGKGVTNGYDKGLGTVLFACNANFTANANVLVPLYFGINRTFEAAARTGIVGQFPDVYRINMRDYSPGEEITVGSDTYVVFPMMNKDNLNVVDGEGYSGYEGLAYRKETGVVV